MLEIDTFASDLLEEAKRFLEKSKESIEGEGKKAYLHAALVLGVSALEAHVNAIADEMANRDTAGLSVVEQSILTEKEYILDKGEFKLTRKLKMYNLMERIEFIMFKFSGKQIDTDSDWWGKLHQGIGMRNSLVHPKEKHEFTANQVEVAFEGILGGLDAMYMALYRQHFPSLGRKFHSKMNF